MKNAVSCPPKSWHKTLPDDGATNLFPLILVGFVGAGLTVLLTAPLIDVYSLALMPFGASLAAGIAAIFRFQRVVREQASEQQGPVAPSGARESSRLGVGQMLWLD